jgi:hypothetical protein
MNWPASSWVGAAYVLLSVGAGLNLGLIAWAWRSWDGRRTAWWLALFFGAVLVGALVALSVVAAYLYYPDLPTCLEDLRFVESETHSAALAGDKRRTQVWIAACEDLVRRTEVGIWIRRGRVSREMTAAAEALRERIEALEHAVLDPEEIDREHVAAELKQVLAAGRAHRDALRPACAAGCPSGTDNLQP